MVTFVSLSTSSLKLRQKHIVCMRYMIHMKYYFELFFFPQQRWVLALYVLQWQLEEKLDFKLEITLIYHSCKWGERLGVFLSTSGLVYKCLCSQVHKTKPSDRLCKQILTTQYHCYYHLLNRNKLFILHTSKVTFIEPSL